MRLCPRPRGCPRSNMVRWRLLQQQQSARGRCLCRCELLPHRRRWSSVLRQWHSQPRPLLLRRWQSDLPARPAWWSARDTNSPGRLASIHPRVHSHLMYCSEPACSLQLYTSQLPSALWSICRVHRVVQLHITSAALASYVEYSFQVYCITVYRVHLFPCHLFNSLSHLHSAPPASAIMLPIPPLPENGSLPGRLRRCKRRAAASLDHVSPCWPLVNTAVLSGRKLAG